MYIYILSFQIKPFKAQPAVTPPYGGKKHAQGVAHSWGMYWRVPSDC